MRLATVLILAAGAWAPAIAAHAQSKHFAYNMTTSTDFDGVYLAPAGSTQWGANQALNDNDHSLQVTERLTPTNVQPGVYDVRLVDEKGHSDCKLGVDLRKENSFEIHDVDLDACK